MRKFLLLAVIDFDSFSPQLSADSTKRRNDFFFWHFGIVEMMNCWKCGPISTGELCARGTPLIGRHVLLRESKGLHFGGDFRCYF
jgi:hypothetical protein